MPATDRPRFPRLVCALALPAFPLALLAGALVSPTDSNANADQLRAAAAHGRAWQASALLELLAAALLPFAVAGVLRAIRGRGAALARVGGVLGVLGTLGMTLIAARHLLIYGLAGGDTTAALHAIDRMDNGAGAIALPLMFGGPLALITLTAAAVRAGAVARWAVAGALLFVVSDMLPIPGAEIMQGAVGIAVFGTVAARLLPLPTRQPAAFPAHAAAGEYAPASAGAGS